MKYSLFALVVCWPVVLADEPQVELSAQEKQILELTNAERKKKDLPPLQPNVVLCKVARAHAENMARQEKMEHVLDGKNPAERLRDAGYPFARMAENLAQIDQRIAVDTMMKDWMGSQIHRDNILNKDVTEIGIGVARTKKGQIYCTQVFGKRK